MLNLSFWKNSKTKEKWLQGQLKHYQCDLCCCFFGRRSHFQQQPFLISSFISHSLSHFFSKMSLAHTHVDVVPPCFWVVINLLNPSLSFLYLLKCCVELHITIKTLRNKSTLLLFLSLHWALYHPVQHVSSCTRHLPIPPSLIYFWSWRFYCLLLQQQSSFSGRAAAATLQTHLSTHHHFQEGPVFQVVKERRD